MKRQVGVSVGVLAVVVLVAAARVEGASHSVPNAMAFGIVGLALVSAFGWWSLRTGKHTPWRVAERDVAQGRAVVLWKPGCPYCERLLRSLGRDERITWVNVWKDVEANSAVRRLNSGDEYVPTVLVGTEVLRNPKAQEVRTVLAER